jgi:peptide chain release factor 2
MLRGKLYRFGLEQSKPENERLWDARGELLWTKPIRKYVMEPHALVKDLRTNARTTQVQTVLDGDLGEFIPASR